MEKINLKNSKNFVDLELLNEQKRLLTESPLPASSIYPYKEVIDPFKLSFEKQGKELIEAGKVACILVAGGQGTRLGFDGPKGCLPVSAVQDKTLFQIFAEKLKAASKKAGIPLKLAIMTSTLNHSATLSHFLLHDYFGCDPEQISFFIQGNLPFLNEKGEVIQESDGQIACGPDGNGSCFMAFFKSPVAQGWKEAGIHYVNFIIVDNPLADPFDPFLIGAHANAAVDVTIKAIERDNPEDLNGLIVQIEDRAAVIEYSEVPKALSSLRNEQGKLVYSLANISLFCFSFSFLEKIANCALPLHKALKKGVWKFERYVFDVLKFSNRTQVVVYPREHCFAPIKNKEGENSVKTSQKALIAYDRTIIESLTGKCAPPSLLEISQAFYYPTDELLIKWKGREIPSLPYIDS